MSITRPSDLPRSLNQKPSLPGSKTMSFGPFSGCSPQRSYNSVVLPVAGSTTSIRPPL